MKNGAAVWAMSLMIAAAGCGSSGGKSPSKDAASQADAPALDAGPKAHCCALPTDGGANLSSQCSLAAHGEGMADAAATGLIEPCWNSGPAGTYGRWTCGSNLDAGLACADNGLSCAVGATCFLEDLGCPGVVQPCELQPGVSVDASSD
jgi:hypothetical protein